MTYFSSDNSRKDTTNFMKPHTRGVRFLFINPQQALTRVALVSVSVCHFLMFKMVLF